MDLVLLEPRRRPSMLWWRTASLLLVLLVIDLAWRLRLLHGGADAIGLDVGEFGRFQPGVMPWLTSDGSMLLWCRCPGLVHFAVGRVWRSSSFPLEPCTAINLRGDVTRH